MLPPSELFQVWVRVRTKDRWEWKPGPPMYGLDTNTDLVGAQFMCRSNAEDLAEKLQDVMKPNTVKLVMYQLVGDIKLRPVKKKVPSPRKEGK